MNTAALSAFPVPEAETGATYRQPPHNIEAEQSLLGAILVNNIALNHVHDRLLPEHFYEPVHQRIYTAIQRFHEKGQIANPVTLKHFFDQDEALADIGGGEYLARLAGAALAVINVADYSELIYDLALKRQLITVGENVVTQAYDAGDHATAMEQIEEAEQSLFNLASHGDIRSGFKSFNSVSTNSLERAKIAFQHHGHGKIMGVTTGLTDLNALLGGMQSSDLLILAGRPSMGKTALATTIAYKAALHFMREHEDEINAGKRGPHEKPKSVGFFSLEMSAEQLATRILSARANINSSSILRGSLSHDEFSKLIQSREELGTLPFFIDDTPALSISAIRTRARRLKRVNNVGLIVIDYLQLASSKSRQAETSRVQEISEITQGLKAIAKELNVPVMALSQLSRAVEQREDKRPQLSDLRESGSIEQDADVVMFVFREEYYVGRKKPDESSPTFQTWQQEMERVHGKAEVIVAKQRNGPIGNVTMSFFSDQTRFEDLAKEDHFPEPVGY